MPYTINQGAIAQVTLRGIHEGQEVLSIFHYKLLITEPSDDGRVLLNNFLTRLNLPDGLVADWRSCLSVKVSTLTLRGQWVSPLRYGFIDREVAPGDGEIAGDSYPSNTAVAITKRTEFSGRDQVGTLHMPGVPITFIENGEVTPTAQLAYALLGEEIIKPVDEPDSGATFVPLLYGNTNPDIADPIIDYTVHPEARIMRRRTVRVGS